MTVKKENLTGRRSIEPDEKPGIRTLLSSLTADASHWVRQETRLARTELSEKISEAGANATRMLAGGFTIFTGSLFLLMAVAEGVSALLRYGKMNPAVADILGFLVVGMAVTGVGAYLYLIAKSQLSAEELKPERTAESLKETKNWAESKIK